MENETMKLHVMYTDKDGFHSIKVDKTFAEIEAWLKSIGATHWEIGQKENE